MFTKRDGTRIGAGAPTIMLLIAGAIILSAISCSSGVSEEEFNAAMKDIETEKTRSDSLESELAIERADAARLVEFVDRSEARIAELEAEVAKERAAISGRQERVDIAEAETALLGAFLAWNRKDREGFMASFTDVGISQALLFIPETVGDPPVALRRVMDASVTNDTATIHAMFALAGCGKRARRTDVVGGASSSPTISVIS